MRPNYKQLLPYAGVILFFALLSLAYFLPDIAIGRTLFQGDIQQGVAVGQEAKEFHRITGETTRWTNSLFGGMPNYQISPSYAPSAIVRFLDTLYGGCLPNPASLVFSMMLGFFILLLSLRTKWYLAALGAVAYAFSSYFFILIEAGHIWKFITLTYIPPTIAGILLAYRGKYIEGGLLAALFATLQIAANHIQMSYYFLFVIAALIIAQFIEKFREKELASFWKASGVLAVAALLAIAANLPSLYHTYEYSKESMRGTPELIPSNGEQTPKEGLDKAYITQWSYGIDETLTLLIPDAKGGATGYLGKEATLLENVSAEYKPYVAQMNRYWGDQPFTSGPVYVGAFILALFFLGCFWVKGPIKWALVAATILSVLLSWGKNFMPLTDLFIDYFPLYNKFRTVSSILVIAEFTIPTLAILALKKAIENPKLLRTTPKESITAYLLTGGIALLFAVVPGLYSSLLSHEEQAAFLPQTLNNPPMATLIAQLEAVRTQIFTADAWRSFFIVTIGFSLLFLYDRQKLSKTLLIASVFLLVLVDLYSVDKRYLNSENFVEKQTKSVPFPPTEADKQILRDPDPHYRVLNTTTNTFNDAITSYRHKSIGGYHAAKLRRYQDLIDQQLSKGNQSVLDMLNTKYFIVAGEDGKPTVEYNRTAAGNAWFISEIDWVKSGIEEMEALDDFNPRTTAIIDEQYRSKLPTHLTLDKQPGDTLLLTDYRPNSLLFRVESQKGGFAVFSEIYYPHGWKALIDGKEETPIIRTDYLLRGIYIPAGIHAVQLIFKPLSIPITEGISFGAYGIMLLGFILWGYPKIKPNREKV